MIINCEACGTSFKVKSSMIKETGSTVRCSKCRHLFIAYPPSIETEKPVEFLPDEKIESSIDMTFGADLEEEIESKVLEEESIPGVDEDVRDQLRKPKEESEKPAAPAKVSDTLFDDTEALFEEMEKEAGEPEIIMSDLEVEDDGVISLHDLEAKSEDEEDVDIGSLLEETEDESDIVPLDEFEAEEGAEVVSLGDLESEASEEADIIGLDDIEAAAEAEEEESLETPVEQEAADVLSLDDLESETIIEEEIPLEEIAEIEEEDFVSLEEEVQPEEIIEASELEEVESVTEGGVETQLDDVEVGKESEDEKPSEKAAEEAKKKKAEEAQKAEPEEEFEFDFESELEEAATPVKAAADEEEIGLELDLEEETAETPSAKTEEFDLDFDLETETKASADEISAKEKELGLDLDLEEFDLDLEEETAEASSAKTEEFNLDLDLEAEDIELKTEEFDLGEEEVEEAATAGAKEEEFDLDLDFGPETKAKSTEKTEEEFELDLDILPEAEESKVPTEEFDLDLEEAGETVSAETEDLDLDLDVKSAKTAEAGKEKVKTEEFDLEEIEDFLDFGDETTVEAEEPAEAAELKDEAEGEAEKETLDMDFELDFETVTAPTEVEEAEEIDIDLETMLEEETVADTGKEKEVALETRDERQKRITEEYRKTEPVAVEKARKAEPKEAYEIKEEAFAAAPPEWQIAKRRPSRVLIIIIAIIVLLGLIYAGFKFFGAKEKAPAPVSDIHGRLQIEMVANPEYKFVENQKAGELLVVTGTVTNRYDHPRSYIQVKGTVYDKAGKVMATSSAYCGNMLTDSDLAGLELETINKRLANRKGDNNANIGVNPGQAIPFTVVFGKLPADIDEFDIEVAQSSK